MVRDKPEKVRDCCADCGTNFKPDEQTHTTQDGNIICLGCSEENYFLCVNCDELYPNADHCESRDGDYFCDSCYDECFCNCDGCGEECPMEDLYDGYCPDCRRNDECACDEDEEYRPNLRFANSRTFAKNKFKRHVALELECALDDDSRQIHSDDLSDGQRKWLGFCYDGSISPRGTEFLIYPANGDKLFNRIDSTCKLAKKHDYFINSSCGVHIHIDARDVSERDLKKIYLVYGLFSKHLYAMVSQSRRNNSYCKELPASYFEAINANSLKAFHYNGDVESSDEDWLQMNGQTPGYRYDSSRYYFCNINSYYGRGSVEIRLHQGTLGPDKLKKWVRLNLALFEWALKTPMKRIINLKNTLKVFLNILQDGDLKYYVKKRRRELNKNGIKPIIVENLKLRAEAGSKFEFRRVFEKDMGYKEFWFIDGIFRNNGWSRTNRAHRRKVDYLLTKHICGETDNCHNRFNKKYVNFIKWFRNREKDYDIFYKNIVIDEHVFKEVNRLIKMTEKEGCGISDIYYVMNNDLRDVLASLYLCLTDIKLIKSMKIQQQTHCLSVACQNGLTAAEYAKWALKCYYNNHEIEAKEPYCDYSGTGKLSGTSEELSSDLREEVLASFNATYCEDDEEE